VTAIVVISFFTAFPVILSYLPSLYYLGPSLSYSPRSFNYFSILSPFNFTGLLPDLQLSTSASLSAFKLTILSDPSNRGSHKNGFLPVLDSSFSSYLLCLPCSSILFPASIFIPSHISDFFIPCLSLSGLLPAPSLIPALDEHSPSMRTSPVPPDLGPNPRPCLILPLKWVNSLIVVIHKFQLLVTAVCESSLCPLNLFFMFICFIL